MRDRFNKVTGHGTDPRMIIEKGGYRPSTSGPTSPPTNVPKPLNEGYRPSHSGPSTPPTSPPPTGGTSEKK